MPDRPLPEHRLRAAGLAALLGAVSLISPSPARAQQSNLDRPEAPVVLRGDQLAHLVEARAREEQLRLFAWDGERMRAIPFQLDERTPVGDYAYDQGDERRTDTDRGRLDGNDELVFMARDAGDRATLAARASLQPGEVTELELQDPTDASRGWVYLASYPSAEDAPALAEQDYISLDWRDDELVGWSGDRCRMAGSSLWTNFLHFQELRFAAPQGAGGQRYGPDVLDQAKVALRASYLFLDIERAMDEMRASLLAHKDGPVRILARFTMETYLIWGHWVRPSPGNECRVTAYGNRVEIDVQLRLPVDLEVDTSSELRLSWDFSHAAGGVRVWSDRNPTRWRGGSKRTARLRQIDRAFPSWICAAFPSGSVLARLEVDEELRGREGNALFLADGAAVDRPEDEPGSLANTGFVLDLTGVQSGDYSLRLVLQFGPPLSPGEERYLLRADSPLRVVTLPP
jgi:hypothetical protein